MISDYRKFSQELNTVGHCYILEGTEHFLKLEAVSLLKEKSGGEGKVFFREYWASQINSAEEAPELLNLLWNDVYSEPLFEDRNLIILWDANHNFLLKLYERWATFMDSPIACSTLVIILETSPKKEAKSDNSNETSDDKDIKLEELSTTGKKKKEKKLSPQTLLANLLKRDDIIRVQCQPLKSYEAVRWVPERVKKYGKKITLQAADLLVERTGAALQNLDQQLQQLVSFIKNRPTIEEKDVEALIQGTRKMDVFGFLNAIFDANKPEAIKIYRLMFQRGIVDMGGKVQHDEQNVARQLIGLFRFHLERLWIAAVSKQFGNMNSYARKILEKQASHFSPQNLCKLWQKLFDVDIATKEPGVSNKYEQAISEFIFLVWKLRS